MATRIRRKKPFFRRRKQWATGEETPDRHQRRAIQMAKMKKGIFILPSLLTLSSIFLAFYSIVAALKGEFTLAGALILGAGFFDKLDGTVARLTHTATRFGVELDSLADVISFGVAPALLMYVWTLAPHGRIGWVTAFLFVACGALRLARFNVQTGTIDPKRFNGLPIPAAAAMVATTVMFFQKMELNPSEFAIHLLILTLALSFLMVSSVKFHAFKDLAFVKKQPFSSTVAFVLLLALIAASPYVMLFLLSAGYVISGPILTIWLYRNRQRTQEQVAEAPAPQEATAADHQAPTTGGDLIPLSDHRRGPKGQPQRGPSDQTPSDPSSEKQG
ncbi:MAG: CDP-diacylglycerol--serine O-phosphatidyltransferase [Desulfomonile tiedjei]|nr:CDP-diacylglycerol--serine O-phosphatidyltransferase [Desulfomonile tiedjei]